MYNKGDLKAFANELRNKGARIENGGSVYYFYIKGTERVICLKQRTTGTFDKTTRLFMLNTDFYNNWFWQTVGPIDWENTKQQLINYCL